MRPRLSGHCYNEIHLAQPTTGPAHHDRCPGAYPGDGSGLVACPCPRHDGETRCRLCLHNHKNLDGYDLAGRRCEDNDACARRIAALSSPATAKPAATNSRGRPGRDCECGCGGTTRGGRFQPGHDAKLKSTLLVRAKGGDELAILDLKKRGWMKE